MGFLLLLLVVVVVVVGRFLETRSPCSSTWPGAHCVDQAGLYLTEIHLPLPPECWEQGMHHHAQLLLFVYMYVYLCACVHSHAGVCRGQERALDTLELEFQMVVSCSMVAEN